MRSEFLLNRVLLAVLLGGLIAAGPVAAQDGVRAIPIPGAMLTVEAAPGGRLAAVYEVSQIHESGDLVPEYLPVRLVDLDSAAVTPLDGPADYALDVAFSPDASTLAGCYGSGQVVLWDVASATRIKTLELVPGLNRCAFFPDGRTLAVVIPASMLSVFLVVDTDSGAIVRVLSHRFETFAGFQAAISGPANFGPYALAAFAIAPDAKQIVTASVNDSLWLWNASGAPPTPLLESGSDLPNFSIRRLAFTADGATLVYLNQTEPAIHVWDVAGGSETTVIPLETRPLDFALAPDGDRVVLAYRGGDAPVLIRLSQPDSAPAPIAAVGMGSGIPVVAFASDSRIVITGELSEETGRNSLYVIDLP